MSNFSNTLVDKILPDPNFQDMVNKNDFTNLYDWLNNKYTDNIIGEVTSLLYKIGVDPLLYMEKVPENYGYELDMNYIVIPNNIVAINAYGFQYSTIKHIEIPNSVKIIGFNTFAGCKYLKDIKLPLHITRLNTGLFETCTSLENIIVPHGVTYISQKVFGSCINLKTITLPKTISYIGGIVFESCFNFQTIYYQGTRDQWQEISIEDTTIDNLLDIGTIIECIDGKLKYEITRKISYI